MSARKSPATRSESNAGTAIAMVALIFISTAMLGLMALVMPQLLGVLLVILIFAVPAVFHYLIWGWWLSQVRHTDSEDENSENKEQIP